MADVSTTDIQVDHDWLNDLMERIEEEARAGLSWCYTNKYGQQIITFDPYELRNAVGPVTELSYENRARFNTFYPEA